MEEYAEVRRQHVLNLISRKQRGKSRLFSSRIEWYGKHVCAIRHIIGLTTAVLEEQAFAVLKHHDFRLSAIFRAYQAQPSVVTSGMNFGESALGSHTAVVNRKKYKSNRAWSLLLQPHAAFTAKGYRCKQQAHPSKTSARFETARQRLNRRVLHLFTTFGSIELGCGWRTVRVDGRLIA